MMKTIFIVGMIIQSAAALANTYSDCDQSIDSKTYPFQPQSLSVKTPFILKASTDMKKKPEIIFENGVRVEKTTNTKLPRCVIAMKTASDKAREFNKIEDGEPRKIEILAMDPPHKGVPGTPVTGVGSCRCVSVSSGSCECKGGTGLKYLNDPACKIKKTYDVHEGKRWMDFTYTCLYNSVNLKTERTFIVNKDDKSDKSIDRIDCYNVNTYQDLNKAFGQYIEGYQCPEVELEQAYNGVDEDAAYKALESNSKSEPVNSDSKSKLVK